ncbi:hypothetical protein K402DRAFT_242559 [Aulographum hederae CBS 113979]|uniref:Uncharacterized protein n=1 Tax=Aulographum hederae CBS 113979 TaxID=1176131 RepID=A0A6G1HA49_9PEZI|nr:hypothetical protein K402DRAFT_242559 [Aulographum hederae CBS 113979]
MSYGIDSEQRLRDARSETGRGTLSSDLCVYLCRLQEALGDAACQIARKQLIRSERGVINRGNTTTPSLEKELCQPKKVPRSRGTELISNLPSVLREARLAPCCRSSGSREMCLVEDITAVLSRLHDICFCQLQKVSALTEYWSDPESLFRVKKSTIGRATAQAGHHNI